MDTNKLEPIVMPRNGLILNTKEIDILADSLIQYKRENGRYPKEVIFNEEMAQRYFDYYMQGKSYTISFDNKPITFVVNTRLQAASLIMR